MGVSRRVGWLSSWISSKEELNWRMQGDRIFLEEGILIHKREGRKPLIGG